MATNSTTLDFGAFKEGGIPRLLEETASGKTIKCGWIEWDDRTSAQTKAHDDTVRAMPAFNIRGRFSGAERRYALWQALKQVTGGKPKYIRQITGSCVGAAGGNMARTASAVEIALKGENEQYKELWWLYTYGRSRFQAGIRGKGEGSTGSGYAKAATTDGFFEMDPEGQPDLPDYQVQDGWISQPANVELTWSDGGAVKDNWVKLGRTHLFQTAARMKNSQDCAEALMNGYPITQASNFGFSGTKVKGTQFPIRVATWNGSWSHQTMIDEVWDHPELNGLYFHWMNQWGPDAHGKATGDEPDGGVYLHSSTVDQICREGEVYAYSFFDGFIGRELNFSAF